MSVAPKTGFGFGAKIGAFGGVALFVAILTWAWLTAINGAVIATGSVVVSGKPKSIQHLDGGIVKSINITDGERVEKGDVLITLDETLLAANFKIYKGRLADALARQARLEVEQADLSTISFETDSDLLQGFDQRKYRLGQTQVFQARAELQKGKEEQLEEKIVQFNNQITGVKGVLKSKERQLELIDEELVATKSLRDKGLTAASQLLSIQRSKADFDGQIAENYSELARIENSIQDARIEILQGRRQFKEQVIEELREVNTQVGELTQQILSTQKQLDRVEVKAPVSGVIHQLQVSTIGGVVPPGGTMLQIVPQATALIFEVRVDTTAIDQVFIGQGAKIRFSAFNQRTTPEVAGTVAVVSPTSIVDEATGASYYKLQLNIRSEEIAKLGNLKLIPGMPVEAYLQTDERSVLSYFTKPIADQLAKAFREE
jgi:HlyD family type I secretion membrane fusion protein